METIGHYLPPKSGKFCLLFSKPDSRTRAVSRPRLAPVERLRFVASAPQNGCASTAPDSRNQAVSWHGQAPVGRLRYIASASQNGCASMAPDSRTRAVSRPGPAPVVRLRRAASTLQNGCASTAPDSRTRAIGRPGLAPVAGVFNASPAPHRGMCLHAPGDFRPEVISRARALASRELNNRHRRVVSMAYEIHSLLSANAEETPEWGKCTCWRFRRNLIDHLDGVESSLSTKALGRKQSRRDLLTRETHAAPIGSNNCESSYGLFSAQS